MLVLSRKHNEEVVVGDGDQAISVMVVEIRGDKVRLGFTGPRGIAVHRREVYDEIHRNGEIKKGQTSNE